MSEIASSIQSASDGDPQSFTRMEGSGSSQIEVYGRMRPSSKLARNQFHLDKQEKNVEFRVPKDQAAGYINNKKELYEFQFNGLFDPSATQEEVFEIVGKPVVRSVLEGYNGTIFAYGQTGSGKTFTITGGPDRYEDRGIIPRSLSLIFEEIERRSGSHSFQVRVSYLEIYNESGFDLLDPSKETKKLDELPRVSMQEDENHLIHMKNLGELPVNTVDEALNLLFIGDTNRIICETPSNDASSRSHCIFTINVECREIGGSKIRRSKLHLVDLAGSERVKKTQVSGNLFKEASFINLSLHYLEQVIVALHARSKGKSVHVPYRNSMMTSVLRDSLGGNCKTVMVATLSGEAAHIDESISTARFAQRVAMIKNIAMINEEEDPRIVIRRLKLQVQELKEEISLIRGDRVWATELNEDERAACREVVKEFLRHGDANIGLTANEPGKQYAFPVGNPSKVKCCFEVFRELFREAENQVSKQPREAAKERDWEREKARDRDRDRDGDRTARRSDESSGSSSAARSHRSRSERQRDRDQDEEENSAAAAELNEENRRIRTALQARENELSVLMALVKKSPLPSALTSHLGRSVSPDDIYSAIRAFLSDGGQQARSISAASPPRTQFFEKSIEKLGELHAQHADTLKSSEASFIEDAALLARRTAAFEDFKASYQRNQAIEENKEALRRKIEDAKSLGERINGARNNINHYKALLEQRRIQRGVMAIADGEINQEKLRQQMEEDEEALREENRIKALIESEKDVYRDKFQALKGLKEEIEHLKGMVERSRRKLQQDFEAYWKKQGETGFNAGLASAAEHGNSAGAEYKESGRELESDREARPRPTTGGSSRSRGLDGSLITASSASSSSSSSFQIPPFAPVLSAASSTSVSSRSNSSTTSFPSISAVSSSTSSSRASQRPPSSSGRDNSKSSSSSAYPRLNSTGNAGVDADIARFYQLRDQMLRNQGRT